jgi:hypothetical protein
LLIGMGVDTEGERGRRPAGIRHGAAHAVRFLQGAASGVREDRHVPQRDPRVETLTALPNVGPAVARRLIRLGIERPDDLRGRDPDELFERLSALDGRREDPCVLDTFTAVVDFADGAPARPWWEYSRERLAREQR